MGWQIEELARFIAETGWDDIPNAVQAHAKVVVLDTIGVILAGSERPEVANLRERLKPSMPGGATVYGNGWHTTDARTAALLNGIAGRSIELCEGLRLVSGQAAIQILPGVLAVGESIGASGKDLMTAFVLGYDAAARLCGAFTPWPLAHQNGQASLIAAAAAGARLRGLNAAGISQAMRIAATLVLTLSYTNVVSGATTLNVAGGMSGLPPPLHPTWHWLGLRQRMTRSRKHWEIWSAARSSRMNCCRTWDLVWHITRNYFRLYACCNPIHPALDAVAAVLAELKPAADDIDRIDIATYRFAAVMQNPGSA